MNGKDGAPLKRQSTSNSEVYMMNIVSLFPAATEWIYVLSGGDQLVGRSHACDYPEQVQSLPAVTHVEMDEASASAAIHQEVVERVQEGRRLYSLDVDLLESLEPDLVVVQEQCDVCAVSREDVEEALEGWAAERKPQILSLNPMTLKEALDSGLRIGRTIERMEDAMEFIGASEQRLKRLQQEVGGEHVDRPSVACLEWMDPLMTAGHWMPDVVEMAGGRAVLAEKGAPSRTVSWEQLLEADPDCLAVMPCGYTVAQTVQDLASLLEKELWYELSAVKREQVYLLDGRAYFNRPGPRLYRSIELLATALHPEKVTWEPEEWEMVNLAAIGRW